MSAFNFIPYGHYYEIERIFGAAGVTEPYGMSPGSTTNKKKRPKCDFKITFIKLNLQTRVTSLLRTVCFVPRERKPLHFLLIQTLFWLRGGPQCP